MNWWCMKVQNQKQGEHTISICLLPMHSSNHYLIFFGHPSNAPTSICAHLLLHMPSIPQWQLSTLLLPQILNQLVTSEGCHLFDFETIAYLCDDILWSKATKGGFVSHSKSRVQIAKLLSPTQSSYNSGWWNKRGRLYNLVFLSKVLRLHNMLRIGYSHWLEHRIWCIKCISVLQTQKQNVQWERKTQIHNKMICSNFLSKH